MFEAPIPGESLTKSPRDMPYERPPEISNPKEALEMHLERLNTPEMVKDMTDMLELGVSVKDLTQGLLRSAVAEGLHSIDVSLSIAPVIHEFIKTTADDAGVRYEEGFQKGDPKKQMAIQAAKTQARAKKGVVVGREKGMDPITEEAPAQPVPPRGLMQRPNSV